jgi:molybdopterin biosynthesis enzyme
MATRIFLALLLAIAVSACADGDQLTEKALEKQTEAVQSAAAEGALLARDASAGRSTAAFTRVHSDALAAQARSVAKKLASAEPSPALEDERLRSLRLAEAVLENLARLGDTTDDRREAGRIALRLEQEAKAAEQLAG